METTNKPISELKDAERNVRRHPESQITALQNSLLKFGQIRPVVVDENSSILAGHGLVEAAKRADFENLNVLVMQGLSEAQKKSLMLADNRIYALGTDDFDTQMDFLKELAIEVDFDIPGFDPDFLQNLVMTEDETDQSLNDYGAGVQPRGGAQDNQAEGQGQGQATDTQTNQEGQQAQTTPEKQIRCPHCGEFIWVK